MLCWSRGELRLICKSNTHVYWMTCFMQSFEAPQLTTLQLDAWSDLPFEAPNLRQLFLHGKNWELLFPVIPHSVTSLNLGVFPGCHDAEAVTRQQVDLLSSIQDLKDLSLIYGPLQSPSLLKRFEKLTRYQSHRVCHWYTITPLPLSKSPPLLLCIGHRKAGKPVEAGIYNRQCIDGAIAHTRRASWHQDW